MTITMRIADGKHQNRKKILHISGFSRQKTVPVIASGRRHWDRNFLGITQRDITLPRLRDAVLSFALITDVVMSRKDIPVYVVCPFFLIWRTIFYIVMPFSIKVSLIIPIRTM
jgi:hypothetical protein